MDFDGYLGSAGALRQTESARGSVLQPGQLLDDMRIVAFLGRGATSEVWRVHDLKQDRDYALKIFADWDNRIGYPAYVVEPGAELVFTENDAYPKALVRHSDSASGQTK